MQKWKSYVNVTSLAWWGGVFAIVLGVLGIAMPESYAVTEIGKLVMLLIGGSEHSSPGMMIAFGMGVIGIRAKLERKEWDV